MYASSLAAHHAARMTEDQQDRQHSRRAALRAHRFETHSRKTSRRG